MKHVIRNSFLALLLLACVRTYHAEAVFTSAPLVPPGTLILVDQQPIGRTGNTNVIAGMLHVQLELTTPDALPDETILVIERTPQGSRLVAHPSGNALHLDDKKPMIFLAAASQREYWQIRLGREWERLTR